VTPDYRDWFMTGLTEAGYKSCSVRADASGTFGCSARKPYYRGRATRTTVLASARSE
jgi:hypothetical protein